MTIEVLCKKIGPFNQHLGGATTLSSLTLKSLCPRLGNHEISKKGGNMIFFIAESDSGGDFTIRKTYDLSYIHTCIDVKMFDYFRFFLCKSVNTPEHFFYSTFMWI